MSHIVEEEEIGTFVPRRDHAHIGYYAGDFSADPFTAPNAQLLLALQNNPSSPWAA
jgi:hypothetical protein